MSSKGSFFPDGTQVYTDTNPAGPADTPVSTTDGPSKSSFFGDTGQPYANVAAVQENYADMVAARDAAAASASAAATSETNAAASDASAAVHETNAAASATAADASKTAADTDASNAAASEAAAAASQASAATSEANAAASEASAAAHDASSAAHDANAAASDASAAAHEASSATHDTDAAASAAAAATSETNAAASEASAAAHDASSATHDTNAAASAGAASTSETNAAASASAASTSASNAAASATSATTAWDDFNAEYLGPKASAPTTNNTGGALAAGMLYWNTTTSDLHIYNGSAWVTYSSTAGDMLKSVYDPNNDGLIAVAQLSGLGYFATGTDAANLTGTIPAASLPALTQFKADKNGNAQSAAGSVYTKITFTTERWDAGSYYDAPNSKFTPPAGMYRVSAQVALQSSIGLGIEIRKSGVSERSFWTPTVASSNNVYAACTALIQVNGTDYIEVYVFNYDTVAHNIAGALDATWFEAQKVL